MVRSGSRKTAAESVPGSVCWSGQGAGLGGSRPGQEALHEGGGVSDGHRAIVRDRQQLVCRH